MQGTMAHEKGMGDPNTNWALVGKAAWVGGPMAPPTQAAPTQAAPTQAMPTSQAAPPHTDGRFYGGEYEARVLNYRQGTMAHEKGMGDPNTNWALVGKAAWVGGPMAPPTQAAPTQAAPTQAMPTSQAAPPHTDGRFYGGEYEARVLNYRQGTMAHEK